MITLTCDRTCLRAASVSDVRWLDWDEDFSLVQQFWPREFPLSRRVWDQARADGYRYCAIVEAGQIASIAAEYRFSDDAWMVAAVKTATASRRRGPQPRADGPAASARLSRANGGDLLIGTP